MERTVGDYVIETTYAVDNANRGIVGALQVYGPSGRLLNTQVVTRALTRVESVNDLLRERLEAVTGVDAEGRLTFR